MQLSFPESLPCVSSGERGWLHGLCKRWTRPSQDASQTYEGRKKGRGGWSVSGQVEGKEEAGTAGERATLEVSFEWSLEQRVGF